MKLHRFTQIILSLSIIVFFNNCSKKDKIVDPETNITENEQVKTASKKVGPSGGTIDFGDATNLSIPENALTSEVEISISKINNAPSFSQYGIETFILEPSGIKLNKTITMQTKYQEYKDFGEDLISVITYNQSQNLWERLNIIEQNQSQNTIKVGIEHFSMFKTIFDRPLDLVMEIPGKYLIKSDMIFTLAEPENKFDWLPGHAGLFLGTTDANSTNNDGSTTIESSPWSNKPKGVQFNTLEDFIHPDPSTTYHLYMGARRYDGSINDNNRIKIAEFAISKKGNGYYDIRDWWGTNILWGKGQYNFPGENSCYCSGLVEGAYENANLDIIEGYLEYPGILPLEQFIRTIPVNSITVKSNLGLTVPVKGVVFDKTTKEYSAIPSKFTLNATNIPSGATFSNNTFSWIPDQSNVGKTYTVNFTVSATSGNKYYTRTQELKINVEQGSIPNTAPTASFTIQPGSGNTSTNFTFDASGSSDAQDPTSSLQVRWDWTNDGTWDTNSSTTKTASHQYSVSGTYTIKLEVKDTGGLTNTTTKQLVVSSGNTAPTASFTIQPGSGNTSTTFTFDVSGSSDAQDPTSSLQVRWDWTNDGTWDTNSSTTKTATHQFSSAGTYTIKLEVKDTGGLTNTTTKQLVVSDITGDWKYNSTNGHNYRLTTTLATWTGAESQAVAMGGHLVSINDAQESNFLITNFGGTSSSYYFWIGLTRAGRSTWGWIDGSALTFTNWSTGEPSEFSTEQYAMTNWGAAGRWNDTPDNWGPLLGIVEKSSDANTPIPSDGLVAYYPFSGNANDQSGNGNNGTVNGAVLTTDRSGVSNRAYSFNGQNNYIKIPYDLYTQTGHAFAISAWFNCTSFTGGRIILGSGSGSVHTEVCVDYNKLWANSRNSNSGTSAYFNNTTINTNQWYHVVFVIDGSNVKFYLNGNYDGAATLSMLAHPSTQTCIGSRSDYTWCPFYGKLDDIRIYSRVLNETEIKALYNEK